MIASMTGFASRTGREGLQEWAFEIRAVNGRGLDLRLRLPDGIPGLEAAIRAAVTGAVARGNVSVSLRLGAGEAEGAPVIDEAALDAVLVQMQAVRARAEAQGLVLAPVTAAELLSIRGVLRAPTGPGAAQLLEPLTADFAALLEDFLAMRATEGTALAGLITGQLDAIEALTSEAAKAAAARAAEAPALLEAQVAKILAQADVDPARLAQELALLAVKGDVTEEIDRLTAHVAAARALLAAGGAVGRKLDFLAQEFNREANTLCSKSGNAELTRIGLDLKAVIDQMREQIQNVE
ncbi:YicC/YloC family endoribonuclease [Pseudoroseicyclus sp. CXY001]|uniref:YicC/YloC family endoribonuclease n=1 Tax=Pseudoroseicyclus sp. CXY001 TaxID=3242492 RepID=UPI00358DC24F